MKAVQHEFTGVTELTSGTYDQDKTMIGSMLKQFTGALGTDKYIGANPPILVNMPEVAGLSFYSPHVHQWSATKYWVFAGTNAAAAITRNCGLFEYDLSTHQISWQGFITLSGTTFAGIKIIRGFRANIYEHNTGTVSTSGSSTTITGSGTGFQSERLAVGARIGFGTTNPNSVSTWYEITAINSDTEIVISAPVTLSGSSFVIEEVRLSVFCSNATLYNGGIHLIKGLNFGTFSLGGTVIPEATTVDNIRASYLIREKAPATFTVTVANPAVFTLAGHGLAAGDLVQFSTTGTLTGPTVNTTFYVIATGLTADNFQASATLGGAAIACTVSSGTHTLYYAGMTIGCGIAQDDFVSNTEHHLYVINADNATTHRIFKINLRAALTVVGGYSVSAFVLKTLGVTTVGTIQQVNNGRIFTVGHGTASGVKSLFFCTSTRIYRCVIANITSNSASWLTDSMQENPPGTVATSLLTSAFLQVDYSYSLDRLIIAVTIAARQGVYIAKYDTSNPQFEKVFGNINNRTKLAATPVGAPDGLFSPAALTLWTESGLLFAMPNVATTGANWLAVMPLGADALYADETEQYIIGPRMATPYATRLLRMYTQTDHYRGDFFHSYSPEPILQYYRTEGIDDDSGAWTEVISGDLSGATPGDYIQLKFKVVTAGIFCIPKKIFAACVTYLDDTSDDHYRISTEKCDETNKRIAFWFKEAFGGTVPNLRINLYDGDTGTLILTDTTDDEASGTWEKTTDGSSWVAYTDTDRANDTTWIRYTPTSIADNIKVEASLILA